MDSNDHDVQFLPRNKKLIFAARELRIKATVQEKRLWNVFLKNVKPRFTRQKLIGNYIADFFCHRAKLIVELDGSHHDKPEVLEYELIRTEYFNSLGITVLRFSNREIDENIASVCKRIKDFLNEV